MSGARQEGCKVPFGREGYVQIVPKCMGGNWTIGCLDPEKCPDFGGESNVDAVIDNPDAPRPVSSAKMAGGYAVNRTLDRSGGVSA